MSTPPYQYSEDIEFDPDAKCPAWIEFLRSSMEGYDRFVLQEWFGYCLVEDNSLHKFISMKGDEVSRDVVKRALILLVGESRCLSTSTPRLTSAFAMHSIMSMRVVFLDDTRRLWRSPLRENPLIDNVVSIIDGKEISIDRKWLEPISCKIGAKFVMDDSDRKKHEHHIVRSDEFTERVISVRMERTSIDEAEAISRIRLELPGLLNWAIEGHRRLMSDGAFS